MAVGIEREGNGAVADDDAIQLATWARPTGVRQQSVVADWVISHNQSHDADQSPVTGPRTGRRWPRRLQGQLRFQPEDDRLRAGRSGPAQQLAVDIDVNLLVVEAEQVLDLGDFGDRCGV